MNPQNQGKTFETDIYNRLVARKYETVQRERELVTKYGIKAYAIDILVSHRGLHAAIQVKYEKQSKLEAVQRLDHAADYIHKEIVKTTGHDNDELLTFMITKNAHTQKMRDSYENIYFIHQSDPQQNYVDVVMATIDGEFADLMKPEIITPVNSNIDVRDMTIADLKEAFCTGIIVRYKHQRDVDNSRLPAIQKWFLSTWQSDGEGAFLFPDVYLHHRNGTWEMIDGQHRLQALKGIHKNDIADKTGLEKWKIPIRVIRNRSDAELIAIFRNINSCKPICDIYIDPAQLATATVVAFKTVADEFSEFTVDSINPRFPHINCATARERLKGSVLIQDLLTSGKIKSVESVGTLIIELNKKMKLEITAADDKNKVVQGWGGTSNDVAKDIKKIDAKGGKCYLAFVKSNNWLELLRNM